MCIRDRTALEQGYLIGLLVGDGTLKADKAVLSAWAPELKLVANGGTETQPHSATGIMQAALEAAQTLKHRADFAGWQRPIAGRGEFRLASTALRDLAFELGMAPGRKTLTPAVEQGSSAFCAGVLRGLFDADGSVQGAQDKGVSVRLTQADLSLLQTVQRMLLRMGIASTIYTDRRAAGPRPMPDGHGGQREYTSRALHELVIGGDNLLQWADAVGFADTAKAQRLAAALQAYRRSLNRERFTATVAALTPCGEQDVYDVTVADVHAFDANGLVVHNCAEQPLPPYGCCCLGSIDLTRFVRDAFEPTARFDEAAFAKVAQAVSYTHLDVYKRQTHSGAGRWGSSTGPGAPPACAVPCLARRHGSRRPRRGRWRRRRRCLAAARGWARARPPARPPCVRRAAGPARRHRGLPARPG